MAKTEDEKMKKKNNKDANLEGREKEDRQGKEDMWRRKEV